MMRNIIVIFTINYSPKSVTMNATEVKELLRLVTASPTLLIKGEFRTDKKAIAIFQAMASPEKISGSFKLILSPDGFLAPDGGEKVAFFFSVPYNQMGTYWMGDVSIYCPNTIHEPGQKINIVFNLYYLAKFENSFRLVLTPLTMGQEDPDSFCGRFEIQPEPETPCLITKFMNI